MIYSKLKRISRHYLRTTSLPRLTEDKRGVASIEFAMIAPLMIGMYLGMAEISSTIAIDRKISHAANVAGDLATQSAALTEEELAQTFSATLQVLDLPNSGDITVELRSYDFDDDDNPRLVGKAVLNSAANQLGNFDPDSIDERLLSSTSGVVVARIAYSYTPIELRHFDSALTLNETFLLKPRRSARVDFGGGVGADIDCTGSSPSNVTCGGAVGGGGTS